MSKRTTYEGVILEAREMARDWKFQLQYTACKWKEHNFHLHIHCPNFNCIQTEFSVIRQKFHNILKSIFFNAIKGKNKEGNWFT